MKPLPDGSSRVRIVMADSARTRRRVLPGQELEEQTEVGEVLLRGLIRAQFALAVRVSLVVILALGSLPLLFAVVPSMARLELFGLRVPWLLLGVLVYPFLLGVGWFYVRVAERNEREFAELVDRS